MSDEGTNGNPIDDVEARAALRNMAMMVAAFYGGLKDEGMADDVALVLTAAYTHGMAGGKLS